MPDKIGIIGNTQGVNESNKPKPKKLANTHKILSCCNKAVILSVSFNGSLFVFVALGTDFGSVLTGLIVLPAVNTSRILSLSRQIFH
jgi:hypothetical protein